MKLARPWSRQVRPTLAVNRRRGTERRGYCKWYACIGRLDRVVGHHPETVAPGTGPKKICRTLSSPITRMSSRMVQYININIRRKI